MICPECGHEIEEGHLICEQCGYEVQMVPDFEPDIEPQIDNILIDEAVEESSASDTETLGTTGTVITDQILGVLHTDHLISSIKSRITSLIIVGFFVVIIVALAVFAIRRATGLEYRINNARNQASQGKYEEAISTLENIYVSHPEESSILFLESEYYNELGKTEQAVDTLKRMINSGKYDETDVFSAYDRLIGIYAANEDYEEIDSVLESCQYPEIVQAYQNYLAIDPVFSYEPGEYDTTIRLKISANTSGKIYYTLDGSVPNEEGSVYGGPIVLDHGVITVSAMFVNQYGIVSDVVTGTYIIQNDLPPEPVVNVDSGEYHSPVLITVEVPEGCTVYYTTDKTTPTEDSVKYTDPIPMPVKYSNFSFVTVTEDGLVSDVVVKSYSLSFPSGISLGRAVEILKTRLVERGLLNDMDGHSDRAPGIYTYEVISAIPIAGQGDYYTIREFYHDGSGSETPTDTTYIVEIYQGSTAMLGGSSAGGFLAIAF
ncbi:MAG: chitobiase/beta-hexosaminidase C-terminal domain-containing protein [Lachnospiraceae bacterium]|nr:chitobiase/beta-hexosaminidase C-terminal domain-containing protein [Lachnospiraceae bacterium]